MAMTSCRECKAEISTKADTCPKCGARQANAGRGRVILFGFIALVAVVTLGRCNKSTPSPAAPETSTPAIAAPTPQAQPVTPSDPSTQAGNCTEKQRTVMQAFLVSEGMTCASVSFCSAMSAQNIRITCNNDTYAYRIRDKGAGYYVEFD